MRVKCGILQTVVVKLPDYHGRMFTRNSHRSIGLVKACGHDGRAVADFTYRHIKVDAIRSDDTCGRIQLRHQLHRVIAMAHPCGRDGKLAIGRAGRDNTAVCIRAVHIAAQCFAATSRQGIRDIHDIASVDDCGNVP